MIFSINSKVRDNPHIYPSLSMLQQVTLAVQSVPGQNNSCLSVLGQPSRGRSLVWV